MSRPMSIRFSRLLPTLICALFVAACNSGVENRQSNTAAAPSNTSAATNQSTASQPASNTAKAKLNVNTASKADLLSTIPGMGDRMVHEFEEYRPYRSIQQFRREIGKYVDAAQVAEYEKYIYVPVSVNESDAATLQQIPGLDQTEANAIVAGRPYASREAFLTKLAEYVSAAELEVAKTYVGEG